MVENRGPELAGVLGLFLALTWLFVLLRIYVKTFMTKGWGSDDVLLIISLIFFSSYAASSLSGVKYGTGRHVQDIQPHDIPTALYYWWLCELFYTVTTVFIRLSIAIFLLRICVKTTHKIIIYATLAMVVVFSIAFFFIALFQCSPYSFFWSQYEGKKGSCINPAVIPDLSIAHSVVSFTADWVLGLLPVALIWDLQMNKRTKVSVAAILSLGLVAGIAAMIRIPYIKVLALTDDFLFATTDVAIWSTVEPGLGIVAASAATLRPLFRSFYSLTTQNSQKMPQYPSRTGYSKQKSFSPPSINQNKSRSSHSDDFEMKSTITTDVHGNDPFRNSMGVKGGIKVHRTVEITRHGSEGGISYLSEKEPWRTGSSGLKDERDIV